ncbi:aspartyl/asparaginyl beta-hydroxylase domain-containing protein [Segetibacter aerophilus]|uniref:Aspartyl/asparaginy/proline hydroxylase domain-containing protein n=1 Tax=Segetibacter aerophilus TaxID=670293 RepID=A0A512BDV4_9BACT|nr:aspartyl/asparaginyl beta-hydroxylase domain-containing protein [Segetibacter aerophilus]GEO10037.1 hypothetical protein SAE01_25330 [Segetibacter aerophilus]
MDKTIAYAKLPLQLDWLKAWEEVKLILNKENPHVNTAHYAGEWTVISLRSPGGKQNSISPELRGETGFDDTAIMDQCITIKNFFQSFGCSVMSVRLLNLKKGALIKEHRDAELSFEKGEARLHIPLLTNKDVEFYVDGKQVVMREGECWYINANLPHRVLNGGETDRIHLVIDCKVNEWLKRTFSSAEKTYSRVDIRNDQKRRMISELRLQNTETALRLANELEEQLNSERGTQQEVFPFWLPSKIINQKDGVLLQWLYVGKQPFTDPFFDETISKCKQLPENLSRLKSVSHLSMATEWADTIEGVEPSAFIFHVSRCGSTLVSQMLSMKDENISLSEVPVFNEILQMPLKNQADESLAKETLAGAIKLYGGKRTGNERRLFIKTDSWHLLYYRQLRALYPSTPFVILYRNPVEVLFSQQRKKGMHAVPGLVEPEIFDFDENERKKFDSENYIAFVLQRYLEAILEITQKDKNILLVNYSEGIVEIMKKLAGITKMELTAADLEMFLKRSRYHSKDLKEIFTEQPRSGHLAAPNTESLTKLYEQIEQLRSLKMPL